MFNVYKTHKQSYDLLHNVLSAPYLHVACLAFLNVPDINSFLNFKTSYDKNVKIIFLFWIPLRIVTQRNCFITVQLQKIQMYIIRSIWTHSWCNVAGQFTEHNELCRAAPVTAHINP